MRKLNTNTENKALYLARPKVKNEKHNKIHTYGTGMSRFVRVSKMRAFRAFHALISQHKKIMTPTKTQRNF
jgi:hypothetical protein